MSPLALAPRRLGLALHRGAAPTVHPSPRLAPRRDEGSGRLADRLAATSIPTVVLVNCSRYPATATVCSCSIAMPSRSVIVGSSHTSPLMSPLRTWRSSAVTTCRIRVAIGAGVFNQKIFTCSLLRT